MELKDIQFHDSSIQSIIVDYESGELLLKLKESFSLNEITLVFCDFINISIPRMSPWGVSSQINEVNFDNGLFIQIQSGDEITIKGKFKECKIEAKT